MRFFQTGLVLLLLIGAAVSQQLRCAIPDFIPSNIYRFEQRKFQGIASLEVASGKRHWATWYSGGDKPGSDENYVVLARSDDGGITWVDPVGVIDPPGPIRAFDPCLWMDPLGQLWWFWSETVGQFDGIAGVWYVRCDRPNETSFTWSKPRRLADGVMVNKPTVMSTGEWVFPIALWARFGGSSDKHASNVFVSQDLGETFTRAGGARYPGRSFDDHMLVERKDGTWVLANRLVGGGIGISISSNKGVSWITEEKLPVLNPDARFFLRKLASGNWLLVHQNSNTERRGLVARISRDEGQTWGQPLLLDDRADISYPDGVQDADGVIRIIYDYARAQYKCIQMVAFREKDLLTGGPESRPETKLISGLPSGTIPLEVEGAKGGAMQGFVAEPMPIIFTPGAEYATATRPFQGIPAIANSSSSRLWASWYAGGPDEGSENYVLLARSDDGGKNWQEPIAVVDQPGPVRAFDPCLWLDPLGRLWWFWAQSWGKFDRVFGTWYVRCDNPNAADPVWSKPKRIAHGVMMNKPTVMSSGEWVFPIALWSRFGGNTDQHASNIYVSNDRGENFALAGGAKFPNRSFDEHMVLERKNGDWILFTRLLTGGIGLSVSQDKGRTWINNGVLPVKHPDSRFCVRKLKSGRWILIHNDSTDARRVLMARYSEDEGVTWQGSLFLDPRDDVSYPDVSEFDGKISVIYDRGRYDQREIWLSQFSERDLRRKPRDDINTAPRILVSRPPASANSKSSNHNQP